MSLLVIGHSGQVARALKARARADHDLVALGRGALDLSDRASVESAFKAHAPKLVINAAAYTAVDKAEVEEAEAHALNCDGPALLAELCAARDIPLIHYSTDYVFDGSKPAPYVETDPTAPLGAYGRTKLAGEKAIAERTDKAVILRTAWVYSPYGNNFVKTMLRLAGERDALTIVADQQGCPTSAFDIADASLAIADRLLRSEGTFGVFHLCGSGETSWHGFAEAIFDHSRSIGGPYAEARPIPTSEFPTPAKRPANSRLQCDRLEAEYGLRLPHWRDSMRACVDTLIKEAPSS